MPTPKTAHKDAALTNISVGYKSPDFIADRVFPNVRVTKQSDYFFTFNKGDMFRNEADVRGPGTSAVRGDYKLSSSTYGCKEYAFAQPVPIELIRNADAPLRPFETGVGFATRKVLLAKEKVVSDLVCTAANWTTSDDAAAGWVGDSSSTFIADILTQKEVIRKLIGRYPNCLTMDAKTFKEVKQTPDILDRIKYTGTQGKPADVSAQTLAQLFDLDEVLVGSAIYSSDEEVVAGTDFTAVDLWETNATKGAALLYYREPAPALESPSAGYCFNWNGSESPEDAIAESDAYRSVRYWWDSDIKSYLVEASENFDAKIVCKDAGCLFYDTIVT